MSEKTATGWYESGFAAGLIDARSGVGSPCPFLTDLAKAHWREGYADAMATAHEQKAREPSLVAIFYHGDPQPNSPLTHAGLRHQL
jgi:hypothetical protein